MSVLVSICIPAYNQVDYLKKTLDSIYLQTFRNYEIVLTDDSTDNRVHELIKTYEGKLNIHYHKNGVALGSPANWNKALDLATGKLIKFMHHDDWFSSETSLQKFVNAFEDMNIDFVFCSSEIIDVSSGKISYNQPGRQFLEDLKKDPKVLFSDNQVGSPTAVMFRATQERFDEKVKYLVDIDFYMRVLKTNPRFSFIEEPLIVNTSNHAGQVTAASLNKETQVGEYCYLYNKHFKGQVPGRTHSRFFRYLFKRYNIKNLDEIKSFVGERPKPEWYFKLLLMLK